MAHTSHSFDTPGTRLAPADASAYLQRVVAGTLNRKGFAAAEAGALAEMERLLENRESSLRCSQATMQLYGDLFPVNVLGAATPTRLKH